jgi:hypothetical protein
MNAHRGNDVLQLLRLRAKTMADLRNRPEAGITQEKTVAHERVG